jgi:hypothetical protein
MSQNNTERKLQCSTSHGKAAKVIQVSKGIKTAKEVGFKATDDS